ncbi:MAG: tetratricopeptide repeat protein, partial [Planctomycetota bacterium]
SASSDGSGRMNLKEPLSTVVCAIVLATTLTGCRTFSSDGATGLPRLPRLFGDRNTEPLTPEPRLPTPPEAPLETASKATARLVGFVTGRQQDIEQAREYYQKGDQVFREASDKEQSSKPRARMFLAAAKWFGKAGNTAEGSALQQDALFMQAESYYFANDLNNARDTYEKLQQDFPRNRHSDRAAARLFSIGKYWIDVTKSGGDSWLPNLFDETLPLMDTDGHAIKVLDQIRYDDPTGSIADDATMAAAMEHLRAGRFEQADEFLTDLRETFTDSQHLFLAHLMGIGCKLQVYRGPRYSATYLDEAAELIRLTKRRFPNELREPKYAEHMAKFTAEVAFHQAEDLAERARFREKQQRYGAAGEIYKQLLRDYPTTPQAEQARETLAQIEALPANPKQRLAFMTQLFPSARQSSPLLLKRDLAEDDQQTPADESDSTGTRFFR